MVKGEEGGGKWDAGLNQMALDHSCSNVSSCSLDREQEACLVGHSQRAWTGQRQEVSFYLL